jgi:transposase InsO family protein
VPSFQSFRACKQRGLKLLFTKPYTPKANGKAERFIQTVCANGLMLGLQQQTSERRIAKTDTPLQSGTDLMAISDQNRPSADLAWLESTC